jgi:hypothetical protein
MTTKSTLSAKAVKALTTVALTLPGIQNARSEAVITKPQTDLMYTRVDEGKDHYKIDIYMAQLSIALSHNMDLSVRANEDVMSGASSFGYLPSIIRDPNGSFSELVAGRSGNSIQDKRSAADVNVRYFGDEYHVGVGGSLSEENFYESQTLHLQLTHEFNKTNSELSCGYSVSNDSIYPTPDSDTSSAPFTRLRTRQGKLTQRVNVDFKQDLGKTTTAQAGLEFIADKGYLDDPYKASVVWGVPNRFDADGGGESVFPAFLTGLPGDAAIVRDRRPSYKGALATSIKLIQYITPLNSAVHVGYRFAQNTWSIKSHTVTLTYFQELGDDWQIIPSLRYYSQSEAYFYAMAFDFIGGAPFPSKRINNTGPASSDYRLGKFGSLGEELKILYKFMDDKSGKVTFSLGHIKRRNKYYLGRKPYPLNPDNEFRTLYGSIGLSYVF